GARCRSFPHIGRRGERTLFAVAMAIAVLDEPVKLALLVGAVLIVLAGALLASESTRPAHVRVGGILFAFIATLLFSTRDNLVRHFAGSARTGSAAAAAAALIVAAATMLVYVALARRGRFV